MTNLESLLDLTGCADELEGDLRPTTWTQLMTAIAAGAIDADHIAELTFHCTELATLHEPRTPSWEESVTDALLRSDGDLASEESRLLIACGQAADAAGQ